MSLLSRAKRALSKDQSKAASVKKEAAPKTSAETKAVETSPDSDQQAVLLDSLLTEKSLRAQEHNTVVFRVRPYLTKHQIAAAIFDTYGVKPKAIRTARFQAKMRRRGRSIGFTNSWKKAYVKVDDVSKFGSEE